MRWNFNRCISSCFKILGGDGSTRWMDWMSLNCLKMVQVENFSHMRVTTMGNITLGKAVLVVPDPGRNWPEWNWRGTPVLTGACGSTIWGSLVISDPPITPRQPLWGQSCNDSLHEGATRVAGSPSFLWLEPRGQRALTCDEAVQTNN